MSATAAIAALATVLAAVGAWELAGSLEGRLGGPARRALRALSEGRAGSLVEAASRLGLERRIEAAGLAARVPIAAAMAAKLGGAALGALLATLAAPVAPGRLEVAVVLGMPVAGFLLPDALLERAARRRRARLASALPDALDLLAVGAASGRAPGALLGEIAAAGNGPLAAELAVAVAELECGMPQRDAMEALRARAPGPEVGALAGALERSRRHGSPLADQLREQASGMRRDQRRRVEEGAARAAPKIQLVVALVLVPSVLAMIVAALLANSDAFLAGL